MRAFARRSLLVLVLALPALACGESLGPNGEKLVAVKDDAFDPFTKTVSVGDKVLWTWSGGHQHNLTWVVTTGAGNSATQTTGTYTRTFAAAGSFDYYCTIHGTATTGMRGTIVVQ